MNDASIIDLYFNRDEQAIRETDLAYGSYCKTVAHNILQNSEDVEEAVADTWLKAWNTIPPQKPRFLKLYLAKITRNIALNTYREQNANKRGGGQVVLALDELGECVAHSDSVESRIDERFLRDTIQSFLQRVSKKDRMIFVRRYFFLEDTPTIAQRYGLKESNVLLILSRTRKKLKDYLIKEGYAL